jgi:hypothetical protein
MVGDRKRKETEGADAYILTSGTLLQLHEHYKSELRSDLEFTYKYLNFYVGLPSALLAATIAGLLRQGAGDKKGLLLLFGPLMIIGLTLIGYRTIRVFYRRFIEAWITSVNIETMLTLSGAVSLEKGIQNLVSRVLPTASLCNTNERRYVRPWSRPRTRGGPPRSLSNELRPKEIL